MAVILKAEDLKPGKCYGIQWDKEFDLKQVNYYQNQGFSMSLFVDKYKEAIEKKLYNKQFEFLGMSYHPSGHFHIKFAKVRLFGDEVLMPHQMLIR